MNSKTRGQEVESNRRKLLAMTTGIAGLATTQYWARPVVESALLPAHAQTTSPPVISNLRVVQAGECIFNSTDEYNFRILFDYSSLYGVTSLVATASCAAGDTMSIILGNPGALGLGDNIWNAQDSFIMDGDDFSGDVEMTGNRIEGTSVLECTLTLTMTDANGGQAVEQLDFSECAVGP